MQTVQTFAQKVDLDGKNLKHAYFQLPATPIAEDGRTFSAGVVVGPSIPSNLIAQYVKQASEIGGFTRLIEELAKKVEAILEYNETK